MATQTTAGVGNAMRWTATALGLSAAGYASYVIYAWARYGHCAQPRPEEVDELLDRVMPRFDVAERHHVCVAAPAATTLAAAMDVDLQDSTVVWGIIRAREMILGTTSSAAPRPKGLMAEMASLGWRVLAETPGREIVVGAVTRPWMANVVFRGLAPDAFREFNEPGYVKIAWTLRVDPAGGGKTVFRTETRVATTDAAARRKFRWYWARFSPGILLIRRFLLGLVKREAEARATLSPSLPLPLETSAADASAARR